MTDTQQTVEHRTRHSVNPDHVEVREEAEVGDESGMFAIRMPVSSTTEARDGEAFDRDRLRGFRDQIEAGDVGVFLDHGRNEVTGSRYSALGKIGYWARPEVVERDGVAELEADAILVDPQAMDMDPGPIRHHIAWIKTQAEAGVPLASSVGWSEATGEREVPGDADLLEISIVGIPSDPTTTTASAEPAAMARAVSAAATGFDVETFVDELQRAQRAEYEVNGETVTIDPPDAVVNAATVALAKDDELEPDCGTGAGRESARQIAGDDVGPESIEDIAAYLTSHEEDVTADGPPTDWSDEEWQDCGNLQYALWGGTGTGTGLAWAQSAANDVAEAKGEELPYPERAGRNLDDPSFSEGDAVEWTSNDTVVRGRVAAIGDEFSPAEGVTITGDEGEAVYLIHELDDSLEPPQYRRENVAKPESSLDESVADLPPLEGNFADEDNSMSESDTEPDGESGTDTDEQHADGPDMQDMYERVCRMDERMGEIHEEMMKGGEDGEDEDEDDDMDEDSADADEVDEHDADGGDATERTVEIDGEEKSAEEAIADLRDQLDDAEPGDADTQDRVGDSEDSETDDSGFGFTEAHE